MTLITMPHQSFPTIRPNWPNQPQQNVASNGTPKINVNPTQACDHLPHPVEYEFTKKETSVLIYSQHLMVNHSIEGGTAKKAPKQSSFSSVAVTGAVCWREMESAEALGEEVARALLEKGAKKILDEAKSANVAAV